jgi:hypothetical protein
MPSKVRFIHEAPLNTLRPYPVIQSSIASKISVITGDVRYRTEDGKDASYLLGAVNVERRWGVVSLT